MACAGSELSVDNSKADLLGAKAGLSCEGLFDTCLGDLLNGESIVCMANLFDAPPLGEDVDEKSAYLCQPGDSKESLEWLHNPESHPNFIWDKHAVVTLDKSYVYGTEFGERFFGTMISLVGATVSKSKFVNTEPLTSMQLEDSTIVDTEFRELNWLIPNFNNAKIKNVSFSDCELVNPHFENTTFEEVTITGKKLSHVDFGSTVFENVIFKDLYLSFVEFHDADLSSVAFENVTCFNGGTFGRDSLYSCVDGMVVENNGTEK